MTTMDAPAEPMDAPAEPMDVDAPRDAPPGATAALLPASLTSRPEGVKRTLALHVGYVGTAFNGFQIVRDLPIEATVEGVLERALLRARMLSGANYGDLFKVKWSRNSRTDKGVHSVSTVVSAKLVVEDETRFEQDGEGMWLAEAVNAHLPPTVRVFSIQRVNKKFNARYSCTDRTYEYYLPASLIDLRLDGGPEDAATMAALRGVLVTLTGRHPFHNYAGRRRAYMTVFGASEGEDRGNTNAWPPSPPRQPPASAATAAQRPADASATAAASAPSTAATSSAPAAAAAVTPSHAEAADETPRPPLAATAAAAQACAPQPEAIIRPVSTENLAASRTQHKSLRTSSNALFLAGSTAEEASGEGTKEAAGQLGGLDDAIDASVARSSVLPAAATAAADATAAAASTSEKLAGHTPAGEGAPEPASPSAAASQQQQQSAGQLAVQAAAGQPVGQWGRPDHFAGGHLPGGRHANKYKGKKNRGGGQGDQGSPADHAAALERHARVVAAALGIDVGGTAAGGTAAARGDGEGGSAGGRREGGGRGGKQKKVGGKRRGGAGGGDEDDGVVEDEEAEDGERGGGDEDEDAQLYREMAEAAALHGVPNSARQRLRQPCYWKAEIDNSDRVGVRHYRDILRFTADDPAPLVPGGQSCVRLTIQGGSFMLHQIRHMIGAAVAVARGLLTPELVAASIAVPARIGLPRVPPHTLLLSSATFTPFRGCGEEAPTVGAFSGERLALQTAGLAASDAFRRQVLHAQLDALLRHPDWASFKASLALQWWPEAGRAEVLAAYTNWQAWQATRRRTSREGSVVAADSTEQKERDKE